MASTAFIESVPVGRIFLKLDNPRHPEVKTEDEAIEILCAKEDVLPLARDIVKHGLSPLERFAVTEISTGKRKTTNPTYHVEEGNRRICALKLLNDPDRAPPKLRKSFEKLADGWSPVTTVPGVMFKDREEVRLWLDRVHAGSLGGIGRRNWDADQKQRFYGGSKNRTAETILDYAMSQGMISSEERKRKLTTAQRFLNNEVFRETLGLDISDPEEFLRTRPKDEFDTILKRFVRDLVAGRDVTSRMNKRQIIEYARPLNALPGVNSTRVDAEALTDSQGAKKRRTRRTPRKPDKATHVRFDDDISKALKALGNEKLESLYYSICYIPLDRHTPIVCVGAWSFFETLTASAGRTDGNSFDAYLSKGRLSTLGLGKETLSLRSAIGRIHEYGNSTKHHPVAATFNGDQLNNDMTALREVILKLVAEAIAKAV